MRVMRLFSTTKEKRARLSEQTPLALKNMANPPVGPAVIVDPHTQYQEIIGFGGAFTEAAAVTFKHLPQALQTEFLRAYFDPKHGHGYTLCRTHINSCDFSLGNYAYDEVAGDMELEQFSISRDQQALIPLIQAAFDTASEPLKLLASPWSPPAWMKTNGKMNHGGKLKPSHRNSWANYYCRYIEAYANAGIPIWGLTVQNEPEATQTWDSCRYTEAEERDFVRDHLGPALARNQLSDVRVLICDHNRDVLFKRAQTVFDDPLAAKYVWGVGFHWYEKPQRFDNVQRVHDNYPDKHLIFTEGCQEGGPHLGEWKLGERYAHAMLNDLNAWTEGWIDWNLLLDETGGPNHVGNYCSAPIIANTQTGKLLYQSSYYYIGHFTRFIKPGARRIDCQVSHSDLEATAFRNPNGELAVIVLNRDNTPHPFALQINERVAESEIPAHSIQTYCQ